MRATGPLLTLTALLLLLTAVPDLLQRHGLLAPATTLATTDQAGPEPLPDPALRPRALLEEGLLERLQEADRAWIPRAEPLSDGGIRYLYKRRPGDPELTIPQIRALMDRPPSHAAEQRTIVDLLTLLERAGAAVGLIEPIKPGAAAEWDPQERTLRIRPDVPDQGSLEFARVLNHEAIHVAQSCAAGAVGASPRPLGLLAAQDGGRPAAAAGLQRSTGIAPVSGEQLDHPVYADLTPQERLMEQEAYGLQNRLDIGLKLLRIHCLAGRGA